MFEKCINQTSTELWLSLPNRNKRWNGFLWKDLRTIQCFKKKRFCLTPILKDSVSLQSCIEARMYWFKCCGKNKKFNCLNNSLNFIHFSKNYRQDDWFHFMAFNPHKLFNAKSCLYKYIKYFLTNSLLVTVFKLTRVHLFVHS